MLKYRARASRLRWNALHLAPVLAAVLTLVNTAACGRKDVVGIAWINVDRKYVGVVDHSFADDLPGLPAVERLERQPEGAGVNRVAGARIDRERLNVM